MIDFLKENRVLGAVYLINQEIGRLFHSEGADEARRLLAALPRKDSREGLDYRQHWSYDAGQGCPEEEFESFCESLKDEACAQNALFGRNSVLVKSAPEAAVSSTVQALAKDVPSTLQTDILKLVMEKLPSDANFEKIEQLLPPDPAGKDISDPIKNGRHALLRRWASIDPAAAANYVMSVPERMGPDAIGTIAEAVVMNDPAAGVVWAQKFPQGPYYDAAVSAVIPHVGDGYPAQCRELAAMISDPAVRERSLQICAEKEERGKRSRGIPH
ncbi:MAG: hypothetical protein ACR2OZ_08550 [Verrucomicrobiales bacterium]